MCPVDIVIHLLKKRCNLQNVDFIITQLQVITLQDCSLQVCSYVGIRKEIAAKKTANKQNFNILFDLLLLFDLRYLRSKKLKLLALELLWKFRRVLPFQIQMFAFRIPLTRSGQGGGAGHSRNGDRWLPPHCRPSQPVSGSHCYYRDQLLVAACQSRPGAVAVTVRPGPPWQPGRAPGAQTH